MTNRPTSLSDDEITTTWRSAQPASRLVDDTGDDSDDTSDTTDTPDSGDSSDTGDDS